MTIKIEGGVNIAMKVPSHQYQAVIAFYRDVVALESITEKAPAVGFKLGPNQLWIDKSETLTQAEVWLELFTQDHRAALQQLEHGGAVRCDPIEPLGEAFRGGWIMNPANIVHMVREPNAW